MHTDKRVFAFADFRIDAAEKVLYRGDIPVRLAPKVFDTLFALVSRSGRVVSKDTLMQEIWQDTFVEENNLTQHIFTLRRTLGETKDGPKFIETVSRRGYRFVPAVEIQILDEAAVAVADEPGDHQLQMSAARFQSNGSEVVPRGAPVGRPILILALAVIALAGSLGFALRSGWQSSDSKGVRLLRLSESGNVWGASISPDGKSMLYVVRDGTTHSLRLKNIQNESEVLLVAPTDVRLGNPRFSPDGDLIYLFRGDEVFEMPVFGGESRKIASNLWSNFSVSPDGRQIAFPRATTPGGSSSIVVANTNVTAERIIATKTAPDLYIAWGPAPVFSLDGKRLTAVAGRSGSDEMRIVEIDDETGDERDLQTQAVWEAIEYLDWKTPTQLLIAGKRKGDETTQIWSVRFPDGSVERVTNDFNNYLSFTFNAGRDELIAIQESENLHLWRFDAETSAAQQITSGVSRSEGRYGLAFALDGQIIFSARDKSGYDIYSVSSEGGDVHQLTRNSGRNFDPVVSPDNQLIVFVSDRTGRQRLWLMNRDGSTPRQLTAESDEKEIVESEPYFSADGRWIYYSFRRGGHSSIRKTSIDGVESQSVGASDQTADKPVPSPDGKSLASATYDSGADLPWQIAVESLGEEAPTRRRFDFPAFRSRIRWTQDSSSVVSIDDQKGGYNLWTTNLTTGERRALTNFKTDKIYRFDVSPDGRSYVIARGDYFYDAVLIAP